MRFYITQNFAHVLFLSLAFQECSSETLRFARQDFEFPVGSKEFAFTFFSQSDVQAMSEASFA